VDKKWSEVGQKLDKIEAVLGVLGAFCHCEVAPSNRSNLIAESQRVDLQVGPHFYLFKTEDKKEICYWQYKIENDKREALASQMKHISEPKGSHYMLGFPLPLYPPPQREGEFRQKLTQPILHFPGGRG